MTVTGWAMENPAVEKAIHQIAALHDGQLEMLLVTENIAAKFSTPRISPYDVLMRSDDRKSLYSIHPDGSWDEL